MGVPPQAQTIPACNIVNTNVCIYLAIRTVLPPRRFVSADVNTNSTEGIEIVLLKRIVIGMVLDNSIESDLGVFIASFFCLTNCLTYRPRRPM